MTDPYRYLPCGLHEALAFPLWVRSSREGMMRDIPPGPYVIDPAGATSGPRYGLDFVDLAHPAGWDHAVRACCAIEGISLAESRTPAPPDEVNDLAWGTPEQRREALCRCICAALNLRVEEVFP